MAQLNIGVTVKDTEVFSEIVKLLITIMRDTTDDNVRNMISKSMMELMVPPTSKGMKSVPTSNLLRELMLRPDIKHMDVEPYNACDIVRANTNVVLCRVCGPMSILVGPKIEEG
jgi:uncharacterized protein (UPF0147 family)